MFTKPVVYLLELALVSAVAYHTADWLKTWNLGEKTWTQGILLIGLITAFLSVRLQNRDSDRRRSDVGVNPSTFAESRDETQIPFGECVIVPTLRKVHPGPSSNDPFHPGIRSICAVLSLSQLPMESIQGVYINGKRIHFYWADPSSYPLHRMYQPYDNQYNCPRILLVPNWGGMYGQHVPSIGRIDMPEANRDLITPYTSNQVHRYPVMIWSSLGATGKFDLRIRPWGIDGWQIPALASESFVLVDLFQPNIKYGEKPVWIKKGLPDIRFHVKGSKIPTLRNGQGALSDPSFTDNPADVVRWYLGHYCGYIESDMNHQAFWDAKCECEKERLLLCPPEFPYTRKCRWAINGTIPAGLAAHQKQDILNQMLLACAGTLPYWQRPVSLSVGGQRNPIKYTYQSDRITDCMLSGPPIPKQRHVKIQSKLHGFRDIDLTDDFRKLIPPAYMKPAPPEYRHTLMFVNCPTQALMVSMIELKREMAWTWSANYDTRGDVDALVFDGDYVILQGGNETYIPDDEMWISEIIGYSYPAGEIKTIHIKGRRIPDDLYERLGF